MSNARPSPAYIAESQRLSSLGETLDRAEDLLIEITAIPTLRDRFRDVFVVLAPDGPIEWPNHESLAWKLGESIRQVLKRQRALRRNPELWAAIEAVAADTAVGKGREPYVMLLGQFGGPTRASLLLQLLDDPAVTGHALYALRLLGAPGAEEKARTLLAHRHTWIRKEAKKYLQKVGAAA